MIWSNVTNLKKGQERKIGISLYYQYLKGTRLSLLGCDLEEGAFPAKYGGI